jgi:hypothetical protein
LHNHSFIAKTSSVNNIRVFIRVLFMENFKKIDTLKYLDGIRNDLKQSIDDTFDYLIDVNQNQNKIKEIEKSI